MRMEQEKLEKRAKEFQDELQEKTLLKDKF
jgi:hypothetical protein